MSEHEREDHKQAGLVTHDEAKQILVRFCNSHFRNQHEGHERARVSIPADPRRDDDIRLSAYIARAERLEGAAHDVAMLIVGGRHAVSVNEALAKLLAVLNER